jgi:hypothetical protein
MYIDLHVKRQKRERIICLIALVKIFFSKPILNFAPRGKLWPKGRSRPPGVYFVPWGWSYPLGVRFSVCHSILLNSRESSPLGGNEGVNISPWGQISPPGSKFTPRGKVHPWGTGVKLRMALWSWKKLTFCQMFLTFTCPGGMVECPTSLPHSWRSAVQIPVRSI